VKTGSAANALSGENPWSDIYRVVINRTGLAQVFANFAGAGVCYSYFAFFDSSAPVSLLSTGLLITIAMFAGLVGVGFFLNRRWEKGLIRYVRSRIDGGSVSQALENKARLMLVMNPEEVIQSLFHQPIYRGSA